jgi:hypothetical protein
MTSDVNTASIATLGKGEFLFIRCGASVNGRPCTHTGIVTPLTLPACVDLKTPIRDLPKLLKCSKCGRRSRETRVAIWHR